MATSKTTIELNGKLYDARTGKIITEQQPKTSTAHTAPKRTNGNVVDGFVRRPQHTAAATHKPKPATARTTPHHVATKLEKSKTLMRPAVKKPKPVVAKATPINKDVADRHIRASVTPRSTAIRRFNPDAVSHRVVKKAAPLEVIKPTVASQVARAATSSVDIIEESLRNASAHLETFEGRIAKESLLVRSGFRNKAANLATLSFAGLLLFGFFAYQNLTGIEMRVAATRSGVAASLPGYSPAGYSPAKKVESAPGRVSLTFTSNTNDKKFTVTQQASNWSSDSLLTNHVLASKTPYQTYQNEGKTVYIFDNSNATWVSGGVWYKIDGNASLTSDQLLRVASSF